MITLILKPLWLPIILTLFTWFSLLLWPLPDDGGAYGVGHVITAVVRLVIGVVGTLLIWLAYCLLIIWGFI